MLECLLVFALCVLLLVTYVLWPAHIPVDITQFPRKYKDDKTTTRPYYDVAIVGAGPSGATLAYYLTTLGRKVLLLEKKRFPRDKYCGDAVCKTGIEILQEMGIYDQLLAEKKALISDCGGMCSPGGISFIGRSREMLGEIPAAIACKRIYLDEAIARRAQKSGATLIENSPVNGATFDPSFGLWTVTIENSDTTYQCRVLVCADGAPSRLAMKLGLVTQPPNGSCSRAYVEGGTHKFTADGVIFYHKGMLPGYSALFRHPNDELNFCVYIIPGNPKVTDSDLPYWYDKLVKEDPNISRALGKSAKIERMRVASLRLGGEAVTYSDHLLVVGDAAGMIDPMTGEGIHHGMEAGKIAAYFLDEAFDVGNFDKAVMAEFHNRWMLKFGTDFSWSMALCQLCYQYPILLDAACAAVERKGGSFLAQWADIMTGRVPKIHLLRPEFVIVISFQLLGLLLARLLRVQRSPSSAQTH